MRRDWRRERIRADMSRIGLSLIGAICVIAPMQASADDLPAAPPEPVKPHAAKVRAAKPPAAKGEALGDIQFSNPYAPPAGAGKGTDEEFPAAKTAAPVDPKGGVSFTYKWHATPQPTDAFWNVRNEYGPDGPGSTFLGGLKLGF
jgi:hypothetical protein